MCFVDKVLVNIEIRCYFRSKISPNKSSMQMTHVMNLFPVFQKHFLRGNTDLTEDESVPLFFIVETPHDSQEEVETQKEEGDGMDFPCSGAFKAVMNPLDVVCNSVSSSSMYGLRDSCNSLENNPSQMRWRPHGSGVWNNYLRDSSFKSRSSY